jgi:hypothetical protein
MRGEHNQAEQAPVLPHQGVYKQNLATDLLAGGVHDNTDASNPTCTPRDIKGRISEWLDGQTGIFIHSLVT